MNAQGAPHRGVSRIAPVSGWLGWLLFLGPALSFLVLDAFNRGARFPRFVQDDWGSYLLSAVASFIFWSLLFLVACRRRGPGIWLGRLTFVLLWSLVWGGQAYFFQQNNVYMNQGVASFATDFGESVLNQLWADIGNYLSFMLPSLATALLWLWAGMSRLRLSLRWEKGATICATPLLLGSAFFPAEHAGRQPSTPDALQLEAFGEVVALQLGWSKNSGRLRPRRRASMSLEGMTRERPIERNVVFVLLESVRQDATCNSYDPGCRKTAATNALFPDRVAFPQMRALDSCTAISMGVLWTGLSPTAARDDFHTWPLLFDYAREAGFHTGYFTSQNLMFGNMRLWLADLGVHQMFSGLDLDPESHMDLGASEDLFAERAIKEIEQLQEPFFLTLQLSNGHYPYLVNPELPQPFQPSTTSKAPKKNKQFFNHYLNAIHQEDSHLARVLQAIKESDAGKRTVVVYTSDHGEAFREHHQIGHTFSILDEEVLVPAWIDAPEGSLSKEEHRNLISVRDEFLVHPDLTATMLDLFGVWDDPVVAPFRAEMLGQSLLRPDRREKAYPMTNCAALWSCAFENWGYVRGPMKLEARAWDFHYHCYNLQSDPLEQEDLGAEACGELEAIAEKTFGRLPGKKK